MRFILGDSARNLVLSWILSFFRGLHFQKHMLFGSKVASSFDLARDYTPQIYGTLKAHLNEEVLHAHNEQVSRSALHQFINAEQSPTIRKISFSWRRPYITLSKKNKGRILVQRVWIKSRGAYLFCLIRTFYQEPPAPSGLRGHKAHSWFLVLQDHDRIELGGNISVLMKE